MSRDYLDFFVDMLDHARQARRFVGDSDLAAFVTDEKTAAATIRALTVLGEAARAIPRDIRDRLPGIPWRNVIGMRHFLVHVYHGTNLAIVYATVKQSLPALISELEATIALLERER